MRDMSLICVLTRDMLSICVLMGICRSYLHVGEWHVVHLCVFASDMSFICACKRVTCRSSVHVNEGHVAHLCVDAGHVLHSCVDKGHLVQPCG